MRYAKYVISITTVCLALTLIMVSPVLAGDSFSDLFSQTKICFPHVAIAPIATGWETEVAVINPTAKPVTGNFTFYDSAGNQLGAAFSQTINSHGRYQAVVGTAFAGRGDIQYMIFTAPVFGLKGYTKFYNATTRASIMASSPQTSGLFTKIEKNGWTGIAFVNTSNTDTIVTLTAYSDNGDPVAVAPMTVKSGEKKVMAATAFFYPQPIAGATYISFSSKKGIVGFFLNGTSDNTKLDGSKSL